MNENLNLVELLKDCPKGTKLYSILHGNVNLECVTPYYVYVNTIRGSKAIFRMNGYYLCDFEDEECVLHPIQLASEQDKFFTECTLFPSREQRNWDLFTVPDCKKPKFDPNTLKPFDKVLARDTYTGLWRCTFYSHKIVQVKGLSILSKYATSDSAYEYCIPYNDDTKHLAGTTDEAPECYRYWED